MKATYEFIYTERPVVTILDGDDAGDRTRRSLQQYFGNKNVPFESNKDFISLHNGFSLEGLFPHEWIIKANEEHPNWFKNFSVDVEGKLQPFEIKSSSNKVQLRNYLIRLAEEQEDTQWNSRFLQVFDVLDKSLKEKYLSLYEAELEIDTLIQPSTSETLTVME